MVLVTVHVENKIEVGDRVRKTDREQWEGRVRWTDDTYVIVEFESDSNRIVIGMVPRMAVELVERCSPHERMIRAAAREG